MEEAIKVTLNDKTKKEATVGTTYLELAKEYQEKMSSAILGVKANNNVLNLGDKISKSQEIEFIDLNDLDGFKMYQSGVKYVLVVAAQELWGQNTNVEFLNSLDTGIYTRITVKNKNIKDSDLKTLKEKMRKLIEDDLPIKKISASKRDAIEYFEKNGEEEKALNIRNISNKTVTLYRFKDRYNYFYTEMPYSSGSLKVFDLIFIDDNNFVLTFPDYKDKSKIAKYVHYPNTLESFENYRNWLKMVKVKYVSDVNEIVSNNRIKEFIMTNSLIKSESLMQMVGDIVSSTHKIKIILVAGPSSSGKTTSANMIKLFLKSFGVNSVLVSTDDYFKERADTPKDEDGNYEYEVVEALDLKLLQSDLDKLLNYEEINAPKYNFFTGKKEYSDNRRKLDKGDVIIMEGLHCLNDVLTKNIPKDNKFKVYVSPFTALNLDRHNHVSTIDIRLLRRIVRDNLFRGRDVSSTIESWQKVREGEEKYIFGYQSEADAILNTALTYEIGVLKVFAEPLLYSVSPSSPYYEEAKRLLGFLRTFFPISSEFVAPDCVLREFIGGSIFY